VALKTPKEQAVTDLAIHFSADLPWVESIGYTPKGGVLDDVLAMVDRSGTGQEPYVRGPETATCIVTVQASEVANPQRGDVFTLGGYDWELEPGEGVILDDGYVFEISLRRID
jgi:hypothetical protein